MGTKQPVLEEYFVATRVGLRVQASSAEEAEVLTEAALHVDEHSFLEIDHIVVKTCAVIKIKGG